MNLYVFLVFFQAEDGIRDLVRSRGLGDVYKRQDYDEKIVRKCINKKLIAYEKIRQFRRFYEEQFEGCLLYTSDAADERSSVDLGGRRIIKKKNKDYLRRGRIVTIKRHKEDNLTTNIHNEVQKKRDNTV